MSPEAITALAALVAAVGGIVAAVLANRAKMTAEDSHAQIIATKEGVFELGKQVDGRLTELLNATRQSARAEGVAAGEQAQRDRAAEPQP